MLFFRPKIRKLQFIGEIIPGGAHIKQKQKRDMLPKINIVFQDVYLFHHTIKTNMFICTL